jgi:hypothetical protein
MVRESRARRAGMVALGRLEKAIFTVVALYIGSIAFGASRTY